MKRLLLAALAVLFAIPAQAQVDRATLSGTVRDPLGAVSGGASVAVTHLATNVTSGHHQRGGRLPRGEPDFGKV